MRHRILQFIVCFNAHRKNQQRISVVELKYVFEMLKYNQLCSKEKIQIITLILLVSIAIMLYSGTVFPDLALKES